MLLVSPPADALSSDSLAPLFLPPSTKRCSSDVVRGTCLFESEFLRRRRTSSEVPLLVGCTAIGAAAAAEAAALAPVGVVGRLGESSLAAESDANESMLEGRLPVRNLRRTISSFEPRLPLLASSSCISKILEPASSRLLGSRGSAPPPPPPLAAGPAESVKERERVEEAKSLLAMRLWLLEPRVGVAPESPRSVCGGEVLSSPAIGRSITSWLSMCEIEAVGLVASSCSHSSMSIGCRSAESWRAARAAVSASMRC